MNGLYRGADESSYVTDEQIRRDAYFSATFPAPIMETPLPQDKDFAYWSNRLKTRQEQSLETEENRQHVRIRLPETSLINFMGDIHAGNGHTAYSRVEQECGLILNTPNSYMVLMGDLIDDFFFFPAAHEADSPVPDQIEYAWALIRALAEKNKLLIGWTGNHCHTWGMKSGNSMYKRFSRDTGAYLLSGLAFADFVVGEQEYQIAGAHQLLGSSVYNPNHPQNRSYLMGGAWGADVVVSAHTHVKGMQVKYHQGYGNKSRRALYINVGTYKWTDEFIRDKGFGDKRMHDAVDEDAVGMYGASIILHKDARRIQHFDSIVTAHQDFVSMCVSDGSGGSL